MNKNIAPRVIWNTHEETLFYFQIAVTHMARICTRSKIKTIKFQRNFDLENMIIRYTSLIVSISIAFSN